MRRRLPVLWFALPLVLAACGSSDTSSSSPRGNDGTGDVEPGLPAGGADKGSSSGAGTDFSGPTPVAEPPSGAGGGSSAGGGALSVGGGTASGGGGTAPAGLLTAGDYSDNLNFELFQDYLQGLDPSVKKGTLESADRVVIHVANDSGEPVAGALVAIAGAEPVITVPTGGDGTALFFPAHDGAVTGEQLTVTVTPPNGMPATFSAPAGKDWSLVLPGVAKSTSPGLDLAFVVDTTGSMGDEMAYIASEIDNIVGRVNAGFGQTSIRYGLVVYRDVADDYVTKTFDFTTSLSDFDATLAAQTAGGGGDIPEAAERGLAAMNQLSWRGGDVRRIAFHVADAPPHDENAQAFLDEAATARLTGIHVYPVAASGADARVEYLMRSVAEWTSSRYVFLTDDSGIGDSHEVPSIACYDVEHLNYLIARLIVGELHGKIAPPSAADVVRTVGNPVNGACQLANGKQAVMY